MSKIKQKIAKEVLTILGVKVRKGTKKAAALQAKADKLKKQKETASKIDKRIKDAIKKGGGDTKEYSRKLSNQNLKSAPLAKKKKAEATKKVRAANKETNKKGQSQTQKDVRFKGKGKIAGAKDQPYEPSMDIATVSGRTGTTARGEKISVGDDVMGFSNFIKMQQSKSGLSIAKYKEKLNQITRSKEASQAQKDAAKKKLNRMEAKDVTDEANRKFKSGVTQKGKPKKKPDDFKIAQQEIEKYGVMNKEFEKLTKPQQEALMRSAKLKQKLGLQKGGLAMPKPSQTGLKKLPTPVRNKMGYMYGGGMAKKKKTGSMDYRKGGLVIMIGMGKPKKGIK